MTTLYRIVATKPGEEPVVHTDDAMCLSDIWRVTAGTALALAGWTLSETLTVDDVLSEGVADAQKHDLGREPAQVGTPSLSALPLSNVIPLRVRGTDDGRAA